MEKFRAALNRAELFEIRRKNKKYTWSNEQHNPTLVALDRVFCNVRWGTLFPQHLLHAASTSVSDHCPLILANACAPSGRTRFRFEAFWPKFPGFHETVTDAWMRPIQSSCRSLSDAEWELRKKLKLRLLGLDTIERARKKHSSRINWLRAGDVNTAFFHAKINARRRKNFILSLKKGNYSMANYKEKGGGDLRPLSWHHRPEAQAKLHHQLGSDQPAAD